MADEYPLFVSLPFLNAVWSATDNPKKKNRSDPPSFIERPQSIESELGENITMHCIVDSNPKADIVWVFDPIDRVRLPVLRMPPK